MVPALAFRSSSFCFALAALLLLLLSSMPLRAASYTWDGGGGNDFWSAAANWNPDGAPVNNGMADLHFAGAVRLTPFADAPYSLNSLSFDSGASSFSLSGNLLSIGAGGIAQNSANAQTINNAIALGAAQTWTAAAGSLTLNGGATINNNGNPLTLSAASGMAITLNGSISGSGGLTASGAGTG